MSQAESKSKAIHTHDKERGSNGLVEVTINKKLYDEAKRYNIDLIAAIQEHIHRVQQK